MTAAKPSRLKRATQAATVSLSQRPAVLLPPDGSAQRRPPARPLPGQPEPPARSANSSAASALRVPPRSRRATDPSGNVTYPPRDISLADIIPKLVPLAGIIPKLVPNDP